MFSKELNIIDNPFLKKGMGSRLFDAEGIGSKKLDLISNGILNNWLLDLSSSKQVEK